MVKVKLQKENQNAANQVLEFLKEFPGANHTELCILINHNKYVLNRPGYLDKVMHYKNYANIFKYLYENNLVYYVYEGKYKKYYLVDKDTNLHYSNKTKESIRQDNISKDTNEQMIVAGNGLSILSDKIFINDINPKLGDYVETNKHNYYGRIYSKYHSFKDCNENDEWFNMQEPKLDIKTKSEAWYSILANGGGAILVPESDIKLIYAGKPDKGFSNTWENYYFRN